MLNLTTALQGRRRCASSTRARRQAGQLQPKTGTSCALPEKTLKFLLNNQPQLIIIDCSHEPRPQPPRNHCDLNTVRAINQVIGCPRVILTHISHRFDAWMMENALPAGFEAGFDGMEIALD